MSDLGLCWYYPFWWLIMFPQVGFGQHHQQPSPVNPRTVVDCWTWQTSNQDSFKKHVHYEPNASFQWVYSGGQLDGSQIRLFMCKKILCINIHIYIYPLLTIHSQPSFYIFDFLQALRTAARPLPVDEQQPNVTIFCVWTQKYFTNNLSDGPRWQPGAMMTMVRYHFTVGCVDVPIGVTMFSKM